jgi:hypothetical protein
MRWVIALALGTRGGLWRVPCINTWITFTAIPKRSVCRVACVGEWGDAMTRQAVVSRQTRHLWMCKLLYGDSEIHDCSHLQSDIIQPTFTPQTHTQPLPIRPSTRRVGDARIVPSSFHVPPTRSYDQLFQKRYLPHGLIHAIASYNFQRRMSRLEQRWRAQRSVINIVNCRIPWTNRYLNVYCAFGISLKACLLQCLLLFIPAFASIAASFCASRRLLARDACSASSLCATTIDWASLLFVWA